MEKNSKTEASIVAEEDKRIASRIKKYTFGTTMSIFVTCAVLVLLTSASTYWWVKNKSDADINTKDDRITSLENKVTKLEKELDSEKALSLGLDGSEESDDGATCVSTAPSETAQENIIASVNVANTQPLEGYMAESVNVILAATEAYGAQTKTEAALDISSFVSDSISNWDFELSASILSSYGSGGYSQYFPNNAIVGKSVSGKVISFSFDCNGKISTVFMASAEELLE